MNLLRPPLLRAGSLAAARMPSRISGQLVEPAAVEIGAEACAAPPQPAPAPARPAPPGSTGHAADRNQALQAARQLARQHHISPAELADPTERAAAIAEARALIAAHGISRRQLFGR